MAINKDDAVNTVTAQADAKPVVKPPHPIVRFLREVQAELRKTTWPTRNELTKATVVVVLTIVIVAICLFVYDVAFSHFMQAVHITNPSSSSAIPGQ